MPAGPESYDTAGWYEASGECSCWQPRVLIVAAGAAMVDYLSKYGSCGEFTGVDNVHIAIKSNKLSATRALSAEKIHGLAGKTT